MIAGTLGDRGFGRSVPVRRASVAAVRRGLGLILMITTAAIAIAVIVMTASEAGAGMNPMAGIIGRDDRQMLDPTAWPWLAIGRVNRTSGGFCTGTLVGPDRVLTARHCLFNPRTGRMVQPDTIHFLAGYRRGEWLRHGVGRAFILPEGHAGQNQHAGPGDDWVLIVLENALDVKPVPMVTLPPDQAAGARLARAGYGRDRPHLLSLHEGCTLLGQSDTILLHDCDTTYGDSGSPLLMFRDGGVSGDVSIIGIATGAATRNGKVIGLGVDVRAFEQQSRQPPTTDDE